MKVSELFVELGFNVKGEDKLRTFEISLTNAANAATRLVVAMRLLNGLKVPPAFQHLKSVKMESSTIPSPQAREAQATTSATMVNGLKSVLKGLGLVVAIQQLVKSIKGLARDAMQTQFAMKQMSQQTSLSRDTVRQWQFVAERAGMTAEDMNQQLMQLESIGMDIVAGRREAASPSLGVRQTQAADVVITELARKLRGRSPREMRMFAAEYGVDPRIIATLNEFPDVLSDASRRISATAESAKSIDAFNVAINNLTFLLKDQLTVAMARMAPWLNDFTRYLELQSRTTVIPFFEKLAAEHDYTAAWLMKQLGVWQGEGHTVELNPRHPMFFRKENPAGYQQDLGYQQAMRQLRQSPYLYPNKSNVNNVNTNVYGAEGAKDTADMVERAIERALDRQYGGSYNQSLQTTQPSIDFFAQPATP